MTIYKRNFLFHYTHPLWNDWELLYKCFFFTIEIMATQPFLPPNAESNRSYTNGILWYSNKVWAGLEKHVLAKSATRSPYTVCVNCTPKIKILHCDLTRPHVCSRYNIILCPLLWSSKCMILWWKAVFLDSWIPWVDIIWHVLEILHANKIRNENLQTWLHGSRSFWYKVVSIQVVSIQVKVDS